MLTALLFVPAFYVLLFLNYNKIFVDPGVKIARTQLASFSTIWRPTACQKVTFLAVTYSGSAYRTR